MRILILAPNQARRALQSLRLITAISELEPTLNIDVLCSRDVAGLFKACPLVFNTVTFDADSDTVHLDSIWQTMVKLKAAQYDRVYHLEHNWFYALASLLIGIRHRYGFQSAQANLRSLLYTRTVPFKAANRKRITGLRDWLRLALPEANMVQIRQRSEAIPTLRPKMYDPDYIRRKHGVSALQPIIIFAAAQGSPLALKELPNHSDDDAKLVHWPSRYFADLSLQYVSQHQISQVVFMGDVVDRPRATETMTMIPLASHNLCGVTNIAESVSIMSTAKLCVSADPFWLDLARSLRVVAIDLNHVASPELALQHIAQAFRSIASPAVCDPPPFSIPKSNSDSAPDTPSVY